MVLWGGVEAAAGCLVAFGREDLVGYALFHVVGFAREDGEGLVLRLPAKAGDAAVIAVAVHSAANAELVFLRIGRKVRENRAVGNRFDQPSPKQRCGDAERGVVLGCGGGEIGLRELASHGIGSPRDGKQVVNTAIGRAIRDCFEADDTDRAALLYEGGNSILRAEQGSHGDLRVHGGAGAAPEGCGMAARAAVEIEARAESGIGRAWLCAGDGIEGAEAAQSFHEEAEFRAVDAGERVAGRGGSGARTGVGLRLHNRHGE